MDKQIGKKRLSRKIWILVIIIIGLLAVLIMVSFIGRPGSYFSRNGFSTLPVIQENIEALTGENFESVSKWVVRNMQLDEQRICIDLKTGEERVMNKEELISLGVFLNQKEDLDYVAHAYVWRFTIKFPECPEFLKKALAQIPLEKGKSANINEILPWLPFSPVLMKTVNKKTGKDIDLRYLQCNLTDFSEDYKTFVFQTEKFGLSNNQEFAGRINGVNRLFWTPDFRWVMESGLFYRNH